MIGMLTFINPPRRKKARARLRRGRRGVAREGKEVSMARKKSVRRRGRRRLARRARPVTHRRRRSASRRRRSSGRRRRRSSGRRRRMMLMNPAPKRRRRRNPLFRSTRTGRYKGGRPGRRLRRIRRAPYGWKNPGRRRGGRRRYRRNPGAMALRRRVSPLKDPVSAIMNVFKEAFSMETLEAALQSGIGFGGTLAGSKLVYNTLVPAFNTQVGRVASGFAVTILETLVLGWLGGPKIGARVLTGGVLATLWQGISEAVRGTPAAQWIPTLGEGPEDAEFRQAIEAEVLRELRGGGMDMYLPPAGISYLPAAGSSAYLTGRESDRLLATGVNAYLTERELAKVTGMGDSDGEFGGASAPEQF